MGQNIDFVEEKTLKLIMGLVVILFAVCLDAEQPHQ